MRLADVSLASGTLETVPVCGSKAGAIIRQAIEILSTVMTSFAAGRAIDVGKSSSTPRHTPLMT